MTRGLPRTNPYLPPPFNKLHHVSTAVSRELEMPVHLNNAESEVTALLDSGAYSNYVSLQWLEDNNLLSEMSQVEGEYIQLGGTSKRLPVLGRVSLQTTLANETALLNFVVFESARHCIIGLESLVLHFLDTFQAKLQVLKEELHRQGRGEELNAITKLFPKEPGKVQPEPADFATELKVGEEIVISNGEQTLAQEENTREEELKEIFAVPLPTNGLSQELIDGMVGLELKNVIETRDGKTFHFYDKMQSALQSELGTKCFTYKIDMDRHSVDTGKD